MRFPDGYQHVWNALACLPCLLVVFTVGDMAIQAYPAVTKNIHPWIGTIWIKHNTRQKWCGETIVWIHVVVLQSKVDQKSGVNFAGLTKKASYGFLNFSLANPHVQCVISSQRDLESPGVADVSLRCWTARNAPRRTSIAELQALDTKQGDWRSWTNSTFLTPHKSMVS